MRYKGKSTLFAAYRFVLSDPRFSIADRMEFSLFLAAVGLLLLMGMLFVAKAIWWVQVPGERVIVFALILVLAVWSSRIQRRFTKAYLESVGVTPEAWQREKAMQATVSDYYSRSSGGRVRKLAAWIAVVFFVGTIFLLLSGAAESAWFLPLAILEGLLALMAAMVLAYFTWHPPPPAFETASSAWPSRRATVIGTALVVLLMVIITLLIVWRLNAVHAVP